MKGISGDFAAKEVHADRIIRVVEIKPFTTKWLKVNNVGLDAFTCVFESREDITKAKNVKTVLRHKAIWESLKKGGSIQCYRCQRFGHFSQYCAFKERCVKCKAAHDKGNCSVEASAGLTATACVNCGNPGHSTSYLSG